MEQKVTSILETVEISTGIRTVLREFDHLIEAPNWLPDGKKLLYNAGGGLWLFDLATGESVRIGEGLADYCNNDHVLSPDGKFVGISQGAAGDWRSRIYVMPLSGRELRPVTEASPSYLHGWSPDGSTLAYCAERNGEFDIYTIPVEGGEERRLTDAPGLNDGPEYSPDGRQIWFNSVRTGLMQIWRRTPDGSVQTRVTFHEDLVPPSFPRRQESGLYRLSQGRCGTRRPPCQSKRGDPSHGSGRHGGHGAVQPVRRTGHLKRQQLVPLREAARLCQLPAGLILFNGLFLPLTFLWEAGILKP